MAHLIPLIEIISAVNDVDWAVWNSSRSVYLEHF